MRAKENKNNVWVGLADKSVGGEVWIGRWLKNTGLQLTDAGSKKRNHATITPDITPTFAN